MAWTKAEVLALLDGYARAPRASGPVQLSPAYLRAVERWEGLPENADGADKTWVVQSQRAWKEHFARARAGNRW